MTMLYAVVPLRYTSVPMSEHLQYQTIFVFMSFFVSFFLPVLLVVQSVIKISKLIWFNLFFHSRKQILVTDVC